MRRALNIYHLVNLLHILFYAYLMVRVLNIGNIRGLVEGNSRLILIGYFIVFIALTYYARKVGNGLENPMRTVPLARILHFISLAVFVLAFVLFSQLGRGYIYLMLLSFPIDSIAFIIAYRNSQPQEKDADNLLDDFSDSETDSQ
ncbi:MAG: hypothetical protein HYZ14_04485 [Bacteroidetes bacterium]|nr:hypothetical protein [Bacteroidota bacterium]